MLLTDDLSVFYVVNTGKESRATLRSVVMWWMKKLQILGVGNNWLLFSWSYCYNLFLCDVGWEIGWYQLINSVVSAFSFFDPQEWSICLSWCHLKSALYQRASSEKWEHLADGGPDLTCGWNSASSPAVRVRSVQTPGYSLDSEFILTACLSVVLSAGHVSISKKKKTSEASADFHGSKRVL